jgi:hypothetical protein
VQTAFNSRKYLTRNTIKKMSESGFLRLKNEQDLKAKTILNILKSSKS